MASWRPTVEALVSRAQLPNDAVPRCAAIKEQRGGEVCCLESYLPAVTPDVKILYRITLLVLYRISGEIRLVKIDVQHYQEARDDTVDCAAQRRLGGARAHTRHTHTHTHTHTDVVVTVSVLCPWTNVLRTASQHGVLSASLYVSLRRVQHTGTHDTVTPLGVRPHFSQRIFVPRSLTVASPSARCTAAIVTQLPCIFFSRPTANASLPRCHRAERAQRRSSALSRASRQR